MKNPCALASCKEKVEMKVVGKRLVGRCKACKTKQSEKNEKETNKANS
jgi:hypothetical protein